ncbi:MAG: hypothetical protein JO022_17000 [Acidobacteriaceae bacterium]|nr:hypothetical protein [Acidobacteriaceae bacterium]
MEAKDAKPGDILQFRDYTLTIDTEKKVTQQDGSWKSNTQQVTQGREHHTAVVIANDGNGKLTIVEQNVHDLKTRKRAHRIQRTVLYLNSQGPTTEKKSVIQKGKGQATEETTTTITVSGSVWAYRPEAHDSN